MLTNLSFPLTIPTWRYNLCAYYTPRWEFKFYVDRWLMNCYSWRQLTEIYPLRFFNILYPRFCLFPLFMLGANAIVNIIRRNTTLLKTLYEAFFVIVDILRVFVFRPWISLGSVTYNSEIICIPIRNRIPINHVSYAIQVPCKMFCIISFFFLLLISFIQTRYKNIVHALIVIFLNALQQTSLPSLPEKKWGKERYMTHVYRPYPSYFVNLFQHGSLNRCLLDVF